MALLIDGYNLLHASGILGRGKGAGSLEAARNALLNFLVESLSERELSSVTVVFDAQDAPPGLSRHVTHRGIAVRYAPRGSDADAEIEHLIEQCTAPRGLIVVSSDHRLHRAARRRRAKPIDSDQWYREIVRQRIERHAKGSPSTKPSGPISGIDVSYWMRIFGLTDSDSEANSPSTSSDESEEAASAEASSKSKKGESRLAKRSPRKSSQPKSTQRKPPALGTSQATNRPTPADTSSDVALPSEGGTAESVLPKQPQKKIRRKQDPNVIPWQPPEAPPFPPGYAEDIDESDV